jgi:GT2 family glycosyltransferase
MLAFWGADVIENDGNSWHCIAFHRRCFEGIGRFDPAFYPAYFEGLDFSYRLRMVGMEGGWPRVWINALSQGVALHNQAVSCPAAPLLAHYRAKWSGDKGEEQWTRPWGDKPLDYVVEEPIPVLAERYGLGPYGETWW